MKYGDAASASIKKDPSREEHRVIKIMSVEQRECLCIFESLEGLKIVIVGEKGGGERVLNPRSHWRRKWFSTSPI